MRLVQRDDQPAGEESAPGKPSSEGKLRGTGPKASPITSKGADAGKPNLPEGVDYQVNGWTATVRIEWLRQNGWTGAAGNFPLPEAVRVLISETAAKRGFRWITAETIASELPRLVLTLPDPGQDQFMYISMIHMLAAFGPPPDMDIVWLRAGDGMTLVFRTDLILGTSPREVNGQWQVRNPELNARVFAALEAKTGLTILPPMRASLATVGFTVNPSGKGYIEQVERATMETLFGKKAWQSYLDEPTGPEKSERQEGREGGVKGGTAPEGDRKALEKARKIFDYLKKNYPAQLKDKTFEDFVAWLQKQEAPAAPVTPVQEPDFSDPKNWRAFVESFLVGKVLLGVGDGSPTGEVSDERKFEPAGEMVLEPEIPDRRYVVGAKATARMQMGPRPVDNVLINAFPNKANFHWSVEGPEGGIDVGLSFPEVAAVMAGGPVPARTMALLADQGRGDITLDLTFVKPGVYVINVTVTSRHFRADASLYRARTITVVAPGERLEELFTGMVKGQQGPSLFEIGPDGTLRVKPFAKGLTFGQQKGATEDQIKAIEALVAQGKFSHKEAEEALKLLRERLKKLRQFQAEAGPGGRPYVTQAIFLSEERSESWPMKLTVYDSLTRKDGIIAYTVLVADLTSVSSAPRYTATVKAPAGGDESATLKKAERDAIDAVCDQLHSDNSYPDGRVKLAIQLHESAPEIVINIIDTRSLKKSAKMAAGYGGMILGGAGLVAGAVFTKGTTTPIWVKVIVASAALAGIVQAGLNIQQRIATGQFGDDWVLETVDVLQIATSLAGLGTLPLKTVPGGVQFTLKAADKSLLVFLGASTKEEVDKVNGQYRIDLADPKMTREQAARKRDEAIAAILQGAAVTGAFVLFSHSIHGATAGRPGGPLLGERVSPRLQKLACKGTTAEIKARVGDKNLTLDERRFLTDVLDWRARYGKPPIEEEPGKIGEKPAPETPAEREQPALPGTGRKVPAPSAGGQGKTPSVPEPKSPAPTEAKPKPRAPAPHVDSYPAGMAHIVDNIKDARSSYEVSIRADPAREAAIYYDKVSGEYVVVQGEHVYVPTEFADEPGMLRAWSLKEHYHPGSDAGARFASIEDFYALVQYQLTGVEPPGSVSTSIRYHEPATGKPLYTEIGYDPHAEKPYWISYLDSQGQRQPPRRFEDTPWNANSDYIRFMQAQGIPQETIPGKKAETGAAAPAIPRPVPAQPAATPVGVATQRLTVANAGGTRTGTPPQLGIAAPSAPTAPVVSERAPQPPPAPPAPRERGPEAPPRRPSTPPPPPPAPAGAMRHLPPNATPEQALRLDRLLRIVELGPGKAKVDEAALKQYLHNRSNDLNQAITSLEGRKTAGDLNGWLEFSNKGREASIKHLPPTGDPKLLHEETRRSHSFGVTGGKEAAKKLDNLEGIGFKNPFERHGEFGQGFDDIMVKGGSLDTGRVYVIEYKGGDSKLASGQMELAWVVKNIRRLYLDGGAQDRELARSLAKALREGRLKGVAYSTPVVAGSPQTTVRIGAWEYGKLKVNLDAD